MDNLQALAKRLGNPIGRATVTDPDVLELLANAERLADMTERCARIARTLAHDIEDERKTPYAPLRSYYDTIECASRELASFRSLVSTLKAQIPTH